MSSSIIEPSLCAHCQKPATKACNGCQGAPAYDSETQPGTFYCNVTCQKKHWITHKPTCQRLQTRKKLYRVGDILQAIWYMYRENVFDKKIDRVEEKNGKLYVYEGEYGIDSCIPLIPFPAELFNNKKDKQAVLTHLTCGDAVAYTCDLAEYLLTGIASGIREATFKLKHDSHKRDTIVVDILGNEDKNDYDHIVTEVYLHHGPEPSGPSTINDDCWARLRSICQFPTGDHFIIDLSGAQYGYSNCITPYRPFLNTRVRYIICGEEGGQAGERKRWQKQHAENKRGMSSLVSAVNLVTCDALLDGTKEWEKEAKMTIKEMLKLPDQAFHLKLEELIKYVEIPLKYRISLLMKGFEAQLNAMHGGQRHKV